MWFHEFFQCFFIIFQSNCHYVFADVIHKHIFTSEDCGETIKPYNLDTITPSLISFESNNNNIFLVHDLEAKEKRLWVTKNFGETFSTVQEYVRNFFFHDNKLYVERIQPMKNPDDPIRVTVLASTNYFERRIDTGEWREIKISSETILLNVIILNWSSVNFRGAVSECRTFPTNGRLPICYKIPRWIPLGTLRFHVRYGSVCPSKVSLQRGQELHSFGLSHHWCHWRRTGTFSISRKKIQTLYQTVVVFRLC